MPTVYVDTSALGRVLLDEPDAPLILDELDRFDSYAASRLLAVELRRLAVRHDRRREAERLLAGTSLVPIDETLLAVADTVAPSSVGTLDAIHLATALELADAGLIDTMITYDVRLAQAVRQHGLTVLAPT